jgi:hypothetical protein
MLARSCVKLAVRRSAPLLASVDPATATGSKAHGRSQFNYAGSVKGGEVGARNESAFVAYKVAPKVGSEQVYGLPHRINLMSIAPIVMAIAFASAFFWGVNLWAVYARTHYVTVAIERPQTA